MDVKLIRKALSRAERHISRNAYYDSNFPGNSRKCVLCSSVVCDDDGIYKHASDCVLSVIYLAQAEIQSNVKSAPFTSIAFDCVDCGLPTSGSSNGPLCNCYTEGGKKVVVRPKSGPIIYEPCRGYCTCSDKCALDARHHPSSSCRCDILGCAND